LEGFYRIKHNFRFAKTCVDYFGKNVELLTEMIENGRTVTRRTFLKYVDRESLRSVEEDLGCDKFLRMKNDWHVRYYKSKCGDKPCVFLVWSGIEYIFCENGDGV